ncbi:MAG TPA: response regulator [Candidatus Lokiarchaeia archaeon]|nr:response regulator [Candidatus Lokiarchaeia archaeon]
MLTDILIVDDDDDFLHFIAIMVNLHYPNVVVRMARDGSEALDIIARGAPLAVVITDIVMPRLDGNALCRAIRENHGDQVKIIAMTGKRLSIDAQFDAILSKPFSIDALFASIDQMLGVQHKN